ncbi:MAG: EFR1 family ferrodoxin [Candidatus Ornithospirochaeta sp.]|nr:EFR1 family ferrodoxin [Candidatus Ornithospirochaeta sp.]
MKTVLAVFSATGNTLRIAKEIKDAEIHFVEEYLNGDIILDQDTERLGILYPVHFSGLPYPVRRFVREVLSKRDNSGLKYIFSLVTCGSMPMDALYDLDRELQDIGCVLSYARSFKFPDGYLDMKRKAVGEMDSLAFLTKRQKALDKAISDIENERIRIPFHGPFFSPALRKAERRSQPRANSKLSVLPACTGCSVCYRICPMGNITMENGKAVHHDRCISCYACYHRCPENAVFFPKAEGQYKGLVETEELFRR